MLFLCFISMFCSFVFCFQIHALAYCTMNSKFSILHSASLSASLRAVLKISRSLCSKRVRVFENKTLTTVSNPFNIQFEFTAGDTETYNGFPPEHCTVFMRYCNNALCHFDVAR